MKAKSQNTLKDGLKCKVTAGTHAGKSGIAALLVSLAAAAAHGAYLLPFTGVIRVSHS